MSRSSAERVDRSDSLSRRESQIMDVVFRLGEASAAERSPIPGPLGVAWSWATLTVSAI